MASGHIGRRTKKDGSPGSWFYSVPLPPDAFGKVRREYRSGFRTQKLAREALNKRLGEIQSGKADHPEREQTLNQFAEYWLNLHREQVRATTLDTYRRQLRLHILPVLGEARIGRITPKMVADLVSDLQRRYAHNQVSLVFGVLNVMLERAEELELIDRNPCTKAKRPKRVGPKPEPETIALEDLRRLVDEASPWVRMAIALSLMTSCRRGEVLGLKWCDFDEKGKTLRVERQIVKTEEHDLVFGPTKNGDCNTIAIPPALADELVRWKGVQSRERLVFAGDYTDLDLILARPNGLPHRPSVLSNLMCRLTKRLGVKGSFHALRHTHITRLLVEGFDAKTVARRANQRGTKQTLDTYAHGLPDTETATAEAAERLYGGVVRSRPGAIDLTSR
jgi:integrase